jgi:PBP1b-binding outer membrane lipoprotein LpoB
VKKLVALLMALLLTLAIFAGCAKKAEQKTEETPATTEQAAPADTTQADTTGGK